MDVYKYNNFKTYQVNLWIKIECMQIQILLKHSKYYIYYIVLYLLIFIL